MLKAYDGGRMPRLLLERYYLPLFITQFCGAFNDNAFKLAMLTLISYQLSHSQQQSEYYQALAGGIFTLPFFLFSATAGQLADRFDKAMLIRWIKLWEVFLMIVGGFALYYRSITMMFVVLAGMGLHSTFFGPIKYSILPEHVPKSRLLAATALIEASTFIAILSGTVIGTLSIGSKEVWAAILLTNTVALAGLLSSQFIPSSVLKNKQLRIDWNIPKATYCMIRQVCSNVPLIPVIIAISWFWLLGAVMLIKLPDFSHYVLRADPQVFALFLALFSIGIALGSLSITRLQKGLITVRYVAWFIGLKSVFLLDLALSSEHIQPSQSLITFPVFIREAQHWRIMFDFTAFSFLGGMFVVPLYAYLQVHGRQGEKSRTIATNNIINAVFMVLGSVLVMVLLKLHLSINGVFICLAALNAVMAMGLGWAFHTHCRTTK